MKFLIISTGFIILILIHLILYDLAHRVSTIEDHLNRAGHAIEKLQQEDLYIRSILKS